MASIIWLTDRSRYEQWRPFRSGKYEVSSCGRVRRAGRILRAFVHHHTGRLCIRLRLENNLRIGVHQLVAEAFLGPRPVGVEVNHIDGNKGNNHATNLEYVTRAANVQHAKRLRLYAYGEQHGRAKLSADQVREIRLRVGTTPHKSLATEYGISFQHVSKIARRELWADV